MPRPAKGARLYVRERAGREPVWVIRDGGREIATGARSRDEAERSLARYILDKEAAPRVEHRQFTVAGAIERYLNEHAPTTSNPALAATMAVHLIRFFGDRGIRDLTVALCKAYRNARAAMPHPSYKDPATAPRIKDSTNKRELGFLRAVVTYCYDQGDGWPLPPVLWEPDAEGSDAWALTRSQAAMMLLAARGYRKGADGRWRRPPAGARTSDGKWVNPPPTPHLARFLLLGIYTGSRKQVLLRFRWERAPGCGWLDLDNAVMYRRDPGQQETKKRTPTAPIPPRLLAHLRRWRRDTTWAPIEYEGRPVANVKHGFETLADLSGADWATPHTLRHTCVTWLLQSGVSVFDVGGYVGMSPEIVQRVYGHHCPVHMAGAVSKVGQKVSGARPGNPGNSRGQTGTKGC